jgi:hypothetical protein
MSARGRWRRVDAEHWVHVLGMVLTTVLVLWTCAALLGAMMAGFVWLALLPAGITALVGKMTSAWRLDRPWSWWAWTVLGVLLALGGLGGLLAGDNPWIQGAWLTFGCLLLVLLSHPDSRARIDAPAAVPAPPSHRVTNPPHLPGDTRAPRW